MANLEEKNKPIKVALGDSIAEKPFNLKHKLKEPLRSEATE